tara:strand:+ start:87 stop:722 length:636 start_codon:yes stop_codon:yes gene_type:complete
MPIKKKKTKKKKATSSSFGEMYVDQRLATDNSPKQRKINKLMMKSKLTAAEKKELAALLTDGSKSLSKGEWEIHPLKKARAVETWDQLGEFIEEFAPSMNAKYLAEYAFKFAMSSFNTTLILKDPALHKHVKKLIKAVDNAKGGATEIYNEPLTKDYKCALGEFCHFTGYAPANSAGVFANHISQFKDYFGKKRKKKSVPLFMDKEFSIDN